MMLSFFVYETEADSRYPNRRKNTTPEGLFNEKTLLVQLLPSIIRLLNNQMEILKYYFIDHYEESKPNRESK